VKYRIALFDLDGTLLTSERAVHPANRAALARLMAAGVHVAFCTGRSPKSAQRYVEMVTPNAPCIHFNGAVVRDAKSGHVVFSRALTPATAKAALAASDGLVKHVNVYVGDEIWIERRSETQRVSEEKDGVPHLVVDDLRARVASGAAVATKIMFITDPARIPALTDLVASAVGIDAALVNSEPEYLEVLPPSCSKKTAAEALAAHLGLGLADVVAFGDNKNDLELLEACGLGVAMANSHADVLARVKTHIGDNDSDAIARFLDQL
jgi:Cof subfamily protein (haloacid dehalogenase superfamily)